MHFSKIMEGLLFYRKQDPNRVNGQEGNQSSQWQGVFILTDFREIQPLSTGPELFPHLIPSFSQLLTSSPAEDFFFPEQKTFAFSGSLEAL